MSDPAATPEDLDQARRRMQAALFDPSESLAARMEEFRRVLRESQLCAAHAETNWKSLLDNF